MQWFYEIVAALFGCLYSGPEAKAPVPEVEAPVPEAKAPEHIDVIADYNPYPLSVLTAQRPRYDL